MHVFFDGLFEVLLEGVLVGEHLDIVNLQLAACLPLLTPTLVREKLARAAATYANRRLAH